jgi:hypothetical protein
VGLFLCDVKYDNNCDQSTLGAAYGNGIQLVYQLFGIISTCGYCFVVSVMIMYVLKKSMRITVSKNYEKDGLDNVEFKENALDIYKRRRSVLLIRKSTTRKPNPGDPSTRHNKLVSDNDPEHMAFIDVNLQTKNDFPFEKPIDQLDGNTVLNRNSQA